MLHAQNEMNLSELMENEMKNEHTRNSLHCVSAVRHEQTITMEGRMNWRDTHTTRSALFSPFDIKVTIGSFGCFGF